MKNKSNFIGFLDGYKAKNIANIKPSLVYNLDEIAYNLDLLISAIEINDETKDLLSSLKRRKDKLNSGKDILEVATVFGESLVINFALFKFAKTAQMDVLMILKRIILNYVEFAKKCEDNRIIDLAKRIANNLD